MLGECSCMCTDVRDDKCLNKCCVDVPSYCDNVNVFVQPV
jgi:hypothetical protein